MNTKYRQGIAVLALVGFGALIYASYSDKTQQTANTAGDSPQIGRAIVEITVPDLQGKAILGQVAYDAKCASCHGKDAVGQVGVAPPLVHKIYEPSHHGDGAFLRAARNGVRSHHWRFGNMPPVEGISDAEVGTIVAYVRALQRANGIN